MLCLSGWLSVCLYDRDPCPSPDFPRRTLEKCGDGMVLVMSQHTAPYQRKVATLGTQVRDSI